MPELIIHPEVATALDDAAPLVALETAVMTAGLPNEPHTLALAASVHGWDNAEPTNLEAVRAMARAVREVGAVPALTAIMDGCIHIGLPEAQWESFASKAHGMKATTRDLAVHMVKRASAGTTVAGTLHICRMLSEQPIRVMATGGIGGVHHTWPERPDISADLLELAHARMCVVCSGAKSVLDVPATLELLESLSVPVIGFGTDSLPVFYLRECGDLKCQASFTSHEQVAAMCDKHWNAAQCDSGVIIAQPVAREVALDIASLEMALNGANAAAAKAGITGAEVTPFLLREVAARTGGRSLDANISLLVANAQLAGRIAVALKGT